MNNKIFIILLALTTSLFGSSLTDKKPQQKDKNKENRGKAEHSEAKSNKITETKNQERAITFAKADTSKTTRSKTEQNGAKLKTGLEIDSLTIADFNFRFLKKNAHASYYHNKFNGRRTASGKRFDNNGYTAAHKKLPFGTMVKVTNETNGKFVIVEITDRGPFSKVREIDLSRRAFMEIASNKNSGMVLVTLEVIEPKK